MYQCKDNTKRILKKYLILKNASSFYLVFTHKQVKTNVIMTSKYVNIVRHIGLFLHGTKIWHWCKQLKLIKTEYGKIKFFKNRRNPLDAYDDQESHSCYRMIWLLNLENHTSKLSFTSLTKTSILKFLIQKSWLSLSFWHFQCCYTVQYSCQIVMSFFMSVQNYVI